MNGKHPTKLEKELAKALLDKVDKGGNISLSATMREVGYSPATAKNPQKIKKRTAFQELFNRIGISDSALAKKHQELSEASHLTSTIIPHKQKFVEEEIDPESKDYDKDLGGKQFRSVQRYVAVPEADIKKMIERKPGHEFVSVIEQINQSIVYFYEPDTQARKGAIEMAHKVKGSYAPESHEHEVVHHITEEELAPIDEILGNNKA